MATHMRSLLTLLILLPLTGNAADRLKGTWRSDHEESMRFAKAHAILEPRQSDFLDGILGRLVLRFDANKLRYTMPDADVSIQGKPFHLVGEDETYQYRRLGQDQDSIAILVKSEHGRDRIWHLHFVNDGLFWLYSEDSDYGLRDLNFREYFRKAK
jgi:hypothetical protein